MAHLKRRTTEKFFSVGGSVSVLAADSAWTGSGGNRGLELIHPSYLIDDKVYPSVTLNIEGVGKLTLKAGELKALENALEDIRQRCQHPQNYAGERTCRTEW